MYSPPSTPCHSRVNALLVSASLMALLSACGTDAPHADTPIDCSQDFVFAQEVVSFTPGAGAGYGQDQMPSVVLGPPERGLPSKGSTDVLSLGLDGSIVLGFGEEVIRDGPGPDFIVWENNFWIGGDATQVFSELGEISVSADGITWSTFPCDATQAEGYDSGCAGWRPRQDHDLCTLEALDPVEVGGDPFDLADVELEEVRYVRIRGVSDSGDAPSKSFDLDAVGVIHARP